MANQKMKSKIIFMGTPEFGAIVLRGLIKSGQKPFLVFTEPDKPVGRKQAITPPPVKVLAEKYKIPVVQPDNIKNWKLEIKNLKPDLGIVASFGQIIPNDILRIPKYGFLNVHPSLLPKYRGPSPIQSAILNGDQKTGVTIMRVSEEIDAGPIFSQKEIEIDPKETYESLHDKLAEAGTKLLLEVLSKLPKGQASSRPQDDSEASYTKIIRKEDGRINWDKAAETIEREVRAFSFWPRSYTFWERKGKLTRINILKTRVLKSPNSVRYPVGKVLVVPQNEIGVQCGKDFLVIEKLQMEGKKEMKAEDFLNGFPGFIGAILK
jgi:methionyl-tRNA formyltransferase